MNAQKKKKREIYVQKEKNKARTNIYCTQGRVAYVNEKK